MAPASSSSKEEKKKGKHYATNKLVKKRRAERSLPRVRKSAKNRLRDLQRRAARAETQSSTEATPKLERLRAEIAALAASESEAEAARKRAEKERALATKYRKVKFFERRKVERKLRALRRTKPADFEARERGLLDDLAYVKYYPKDKKYISLLATDDDDPKTARRRTKMRALALAAAAAAVETPALDDDDDDHDDEDDFFLPAT